eukprot:s1100_g8.t1
MTQRFYQLRLEYMPSHVWGQPPLQVAAGTSERKAVVTGEAQWHFSASVDFDYATMRHQCPNFLASNIPRSF